MQSGLLNRRVTIQSPTSTQDCSGEQTDTWTDVLTTWASIESVTSRLLYATSGFVSRATTKITMRWPDSVIISSDMRIIYLNQKLNFTHTYNIESLDNELQRNRLLVALVYELNEQE